MWVGLRLLGVCGLGGIEVWAGVTGRASERMRGCGDEAVGGIGRARTTSRPGRQRVTIQKRRRHAADVLIGAKNKYVNG